MPTKSAMRKRKDVAKAPKKARKKGGSAHMKKAMKKNRRKRY